jgi:alkylation response protein AidB-like acyl-CoA dehydrogenase
LDSEEYVINGEKIWITNGGIAGLAIVFANADKSLKHKGICAFLVSTDTPGFRVEPMEGTPLGHRASDHAHVYFENLRVPKHAMLGGPGEGFSVAMSALDHGRLGVSAGALGVAQACLDASVEFARARRQFGKRIGDLEMIQADIAEMASNVEAARRLVYYAAWLKDQGRRNTREVSMAKLFATEIALKAASQAVLIHGGRGYSNEYPVERYYRDIKGLQIYEGTTHIQKIVIARELIGKE